MDRWICRGDGLRSREGMLTPRGRGIVRVAPGATRQRGSVGSVGGVVRRLSLVALDVSMLLARSVAALSAPQIRIPYGSCSRILSIEGSSEGRRAGLEARIAARERSKEAERSRAERKSRRFPLLLFTHLLSSSLFLLPSFDLLTSRPRASTPPRTPPSPSPAAPSPPRPSSAPPSPRAASSSCSPDASRASAPSSSSTCPRACCSSRGPLRSTASRCAASTRPT